MRRWFGELRDGQHPRVVRWAIAGLVLLVFVLIPAQIATQPRFLARYPNMAPEYRTWSKSVHGAIPCQRCHVSPGVVPQTGYALRMVGEFYLSLAWPSRQPNLMQPPPNDACRSCHVDLRTVSPSGDLKIPHRAHVVVLRVPCVKCHAYLVHKTNPEGTHTPRMATCLTCHDGQQAANQCNACHANKAIPVSHRSPSWLVQHPLMQAKIDCARCHAWTDHWCVQCHSQRPASHVANWRVIHGQAVKANRDCEACHQAAFCAKCHGDLPRLNYNPSLKLVR